MYFVYANQTHLFKAECTTRNAGTTLAPHQSIAIFTKTTTYLSSVTLIAQLFLQQVQFESPSVNILTQVVIVCNIVIVSLNCSK